MKHGILTCTEWMFEGHLYVVPPNEQQVKLTKMKFGHWWKSNAYL